MSGLLGNLVTQIASNALSNNQPQQQSGLGGMLGSVLGGGQQQGGLEGMLGNVIASQLGGGNTNSAGGLGSILGSVLGGNQAKQSGQGMILAAVLPLVLNWIQKNGGLSGALALIQGKGMEEQAKSWVSTDQSNVNLNLDQVSQLFDSNDIASVAKQAGCDQSQVCQGISELLPEVMNQLTPQGGMQNEAQANQEIGDILGQLAGSFLK